MSTGEPSRRPAEDRGGGIRPDGRRLRRELGRLATLDAAIDLVLAGISTPTAEQVAARAGVSVASVYRYFDTVDELRQACIRRYLERYHELMAIPDIGHHDLARRIENLVQGRLTFYETVEPIARFARREASRSDDIAATLQRVRATLSDQIAQHFSVELDRMEAPARLERLGVIAVLTSFEGWDQIAEVGLSRDAIARAWATHLRVLLDAPTG
jgi:AcrR family transcriptional regulator